MTTTERRITELDGIRGLAALGVVVYHYHTHLHGRPLDALLAPVYNGGLLLVDLFFVLSGFILAQVYVYDERYPTFRAAFVSRIARLYPLHLLTLAMVAPLQKLHVELTNHCFVYVYNDGWHLLLNLLLLNESGLQRGFSFNGPAWSISTEFIVNLLFLAIALRHPRRAAALGAVLVGGMVALDAAVNWIEPPRPLLPFARLFRCFLSFGTGLLLRWLYEHAQVLRRGKRMSDGVMALSVLAMLYLMYLGERRETYYLLTLAVFPAMIVAALGNGWAGRALRARPLVYLGHISFSVYLLHYAVELALQDTLRLADVEVSVQNPLWLATHVGLTLIASHLTWRYFEMPARAGVKKSARHILAIVRE